MCMTFPGRVVGLTDVGAIVECHDRIRRASMLLVPETRVGDLVAVAAGTIVRRLTPDEAAELDALIFGAPDEPVATEPPDLITPSSTLTEDPT